MRREAPSTEPYIVVIKITNCSSIFIRERETWRNTCSSHALLSHILSRALLRFKMIIVEAPSEQITMTRVPSSYSTSVIAPGAVPPVSSDGPNRPPFHPRRIGPSFLKLPPSGRNVAMVAIERVNSILPETARSSLAVTISNQLGQIVLFDVLRLFLRRELLHFSTGRTRRLAPRIRVLKIPNSWYCKIFSSQKFPSFV